MVVDITFKDLAPAFYSAVQYGDSVAAKIPATGVAAGEGCVATADIAAKSYCLPEDANTNGLAGVCKTWELMCDGLTDCGDQTATKCYDNIAKATAGGASTKDACYTLQEFT